MADKISVQQRKYFVERIESSINDKIEALRQSNAAEVQNISEAAYNKYLKLLKVDKDIKRFDKLDAEHAKLKSKLIQVYDSVKSSQINSNPHIQGFSGSHSYPHLYTSASALDINDAYRYLCNQTAAKNEDETPQGKLIKQLEAKKRAATDELHGINELNGLKEVVNNILKGADVPLLGE
tara:strand:- start:334 stop:873 length:540 start_codon:yes stop_codon:yes gene_type:complete